MIRFKPKSAQHAEILIYDPIGSDFFGDGFTAKRFVEDLERLGDVKDITVRINSPGGEVFDGFAIFNALKQHPAQIHVQIDGLAASIASVIAMSGDLITMGDGAVIMIHDPWSFAVGDADDMRGVAEMLDKTKVGIIDAYAARTGLAREELDAMMEKETWLTVDEAIEKGFADERVSVAEPAIAARAAWVTCMASYRNVPEGHVLPGFKPPQGDPVVFQPPQKPAGSPQSAPAGAPSEEEPVMTTQAPASVQDTDKIRREAEQAALQKETARRADIRNAFNHYADKKPKLLNECLDDMECTVQSAQSKLLAALSADVEPLRDPTITAGPDEHDKRRHGIEGGLLARSPAALAAIRGAAKKNPDKPEFQNIDTGGEFRGMTLYELVRADLERMQPGASKGKSPRRVVSEFFAAAGSNQTTSDFSVALENTLHKVLLAAFAITPDTWRSVSAVGEVSDFRVHNRYRTGYIASLDQVFENSEFTNKTIPDAVKETIQALTYGNIVGLSRQAIINDDMGVFNRVAVQVGRAAALTIEEGFYTTLGLNAGLGPLMNDGVALFNAAHNNIGTAAAISAAAIDADGAKMEAQKDPNTKEFLSLRPSVLLVPRGLRGTAITINESQFDPDTAASNKPNIVLGLFDEVVATPRLSGTRRYLFADPSVTPTFEVAFLNGEQEPFLEMRDGWTTDGVEWKVRHDFGIAAVEFRSAITNAGV